MNNKNSPWFSILLALLSCNLLWSATAGWLLQISDKPEITIEDFEERFRASVDLQGIQQPFLTSDELNTAKQNTQLKKLFLENVINDIIIRKELESQSLLNEAEVDAEVRRMSSILKNGIIKRIYLQKVHMGKIKEPPADEVKGIYEEMKKDERFQDYKTPQLYEMAKKQAYYNQLEREYIEALGVLRSKYQIKIREEYMDALGF